MVQGRELSVKVIDLRGSYNQIGMEQSKEAITSFILENQISQNLKSEYDTLEVTELLTELSPNLLSELEGLSKGLNQELGTILQIFSGYDVDLPAMGCTSLGTDHYYVRNYDFSPDLYDARLVFCKPVNGFASVGFSQQLIGRLDGMNEKGLIVGLHFVNKTHHKKGFISTTIVRQLLEQCETTEEAINLIKRIPHGYCYNYSIMDRHGVKVIVEASPEEQVINFLHPLTCTNHFESEALMEKNRVNIQGSVKRRDYIEKLQSEFVSPLSAYEQFNNETSPLFYKNYQEYFGTLHTVVYIPKDLEIIVGIGGNCKPMRFSLIDYVNDSFVLPETISGVIRQKV
ncbi:C45 family autoproteolytic acyltransferase/hydrolase [Bacillus salitolerans]|uniref:C45 family autoproteolytic acyltransferase/hydrolase n=1 Tax=Bacillus salitolerans TaxID=1437434 RepID=A0ABW4LJ18_9BACI